MSTSQTEDREAAVEVIPPPPDPHPEGRRAKVMRAPKAPSQSEIDEHNTTHCPYRSWCRWCVSGQAVTKGHFRKGESEENSIPTVSMDYMYMKESQEKMMMRKKMTKKTAEECQYLSQLITVLI